MIIGLVIVGVLIAAVSVAIGGAALTSAINTSTDSTPTPTQNTTGPDLIAVDVPDVISDAIPVGDTDGTNQTQGGGFTQITTDQSTWPSGNKIWDICRAIAIAEGYNTNGAAYQLNNPGDISDGASQFGSQVHDGSSITIFPDAQTGWNWLYQKISNHINGKSTVYPASLTIDQFAKKYAANWQPWENIVSIQLDVSVTSTFASYVNG